MMFVPVINEYSDTRRVPVILDEYGLTLRHAGPRGGWWHGVAVVKQ